MPLFGGRHHHTPNRALAVLSCHRLANRAHRCCTGGRSPARVVALEIVLARSDIDAFDRSSVNISERAAKFPKARHANRRLSRRGGGIVKLREWARGRDV